MLSKNVRNLLNPSSLFLSLSLWKPHSHTLTRIFVVNPNIHQKWWQFLFDAWQLIFVSSDPTTFRLSTAQKLFSHLKKSGIHVSQLRMMLRKPRYAYWSRWRFSICRRVCRFSHKYLGKYRQKFYENEYFESQIK